MNKSDLDRIGDYTELGTLTSKQYAFSLCLPLIASWVLLFVGRGFIPGIVEHYYLELPRTPYFVPDQAGILYILVPLILLASIIAWLLPGFYIVLAIGSEKRLTSLLVKAFGISLVLYFVSITVIKFFVVGTPQTITFQLGEAVVGALAWFFLIIRVMRGSHLTWPLSDRTELRRLLWGTAIPVIIFLVMVPVFLWQDMHDDGFEALEIGRSLATYLFVRFPTPTGFQGLSAGMLPMAFPVHWFISLFGEIEASARFPLLLYIPIVYFLLIELIEWQSPRRIGVLEEALLLLGLGVFVVAMSYNATYDVYFADIASLTALECMTILAFLGAILFLWSRQTAWFIFFAVLSYLCRSTALMVLGLLGIAIFIVMPEMRKQWLMRIAAAIVLCLGLTFFYDKIYLPWAAGTGSIGYQSSSVLELLARMRFIRLNEFSRLNFGIFPSGILPFLSLFLYRWQDKYGRILTLLTLGYFLFFFFQGFVAMHHFVPAMVLPLVVFWRLYLHYETRHRSIILVGVAVTGLLALWLSTPRSYEINRNVRQIGQKIEISIGDYEDDFPGQVKHFELFFKLFPPDWEVYDETKELITGYLSLIYYGTRPKQGGEEINYIVQYLDDPQPAGFTQIAADESAAVFVKDQHEWNTDRYQSLRTDSQSWLYDLPRTSLFYYFFYRKMPPGVIIFDLKELADQFLGMVQGAGK